MGIPRSFDVDVKAVEKTHRELSRALHPDKYAGAGPSERRASLTKAVEVNEAWRAVCDPVKRAEALFTLAEIPVGDTHEPKASSALLVEMMDFRETLAHAREKEDHLAVRRLASEVEARMFAAEKALGDAFSACPFDREKLLPHLAKLGELRFYRRFLEEVSATDDETPDAPI